MINMQALATLPPGSEAHQVLSAAQASLSYNSPASLALTLEHYAAVHEDVQRQGRLSCLHELMKVGGWWWAAAVPRRVLQEMDVRGAACMDVWMHGFG
jgi:hypothetical protein